jgi:hypothetical protein
MRIKDKHFQQREFILSSFRRLKIILDTSVYRFADKLIYEEWTPPLTSLDDVDIEIRDKYYDFLQNGQR